MLWGLAACASPADQRVSRSVGLLYQLPVASFLPTSSNQVEPQAFSVLAYEGLTRVDSTGRPEPALATSWHSIDGRHWRLRLRSGVHFHSGKRLMAKDVIRSWTTALAAPRGSDFHVPFLSDVVGFDEYVNGQRHDLAGLRAPDDTTIELELRAPYGDLPSVLASPLLGVVGPEASERRVDGTGPWRLVGGEPMDSLYTFVRNTAYWGTPSRLDSLRIVVIRDSTALAGALRRGAIDCIPGANDIPALALRPDFSFRASAPRWSVLVTLNFRNPLLRDSDYRRALSLALDRSLLARVLGEHSPVIRHAAIPPGVVAWDTAQQRVPQDLARARALLDGIPGSRLRPLRIAWPMPDTTIPMLQVFRDELAAAGVKTVIQRTNANASAAFLRDSADLQIWRWLSYGPWDILLRQLYHSESAGGLGNAYGVADPVLDSALDHVRGMPSSPARDSALVALGTLVGERQPSLFLFFQRFVTASSARVSECPSITSLPRYTAVDIVRP